MRDRLQITEREAEDRAQAAIAALGRHGDPALLLDRYAALVDQERGLSAQGSGVALDALSEEITRKPAYLAEMLGPQPTGGNSLRRWKMAAHVVMRDRWDRGILHDAFVAPSIDVARSIENYRQQVLGLGKHNEQGPSM